MDSNSSRDFSNTVWSFELLNFSMLFGLGSDYCCYRWSSFISPGSIQSFVSGLYCFHLSLRYPTPFVFLTF
jgi:hypothetical protein